MKLYHVSIDLEHNGIFKPRVPEYTCSFEDEEIPRICVCPTIEQCLSAMSYGGSLLSQTLEKTNGILKIFEIDTELLNITENELFTPYDLISEELVMDCALTSEHWITKEINVPIENQYLININDFKIKREFSNPYDKEADWFLYHHSPMPMVDMVYDLDYKVLV